MPKCLACAEPIKVGHKYQPDASGDLRRVERLYDKHKGPQS